MLKLKLFKISIDTFPSYYDTQNTKDICLIICVICGAESECFTVIWNKNKNFQLDICIYENLSYYERNQLNGFFFITFWFYFKN